VSVIPNQQPLTKTLTLPFSNLEGVSFTDKILGATYSYKDALFVAA
jgi:hypothetical protein